MTELTVTMLAPSRSTSAGRAARVVRTAARKLMLSAHVGNRASASAFRAAAQCACYDLGSFVRECARDGESDPFTRAGDHRDLAGQIADAFPR